MRSVRALVEVQPGPVTALAGVSLDLGEGMFGLVAPNDAGTPTFLRILVGVLLARVDGSTQGDAWVTVTLGGREHATVTIRSAFRPEKVVVDPDVTVLQLRRKSAEGKVMG